MKKIEYFLISLLATFMFAACGGDDEVDPEIPDDPTEQPSDQPTDDETVLLKIQTLVGADDATHPVPRLIAEWEENMVAQVTDPENDDVMMFQYVNTHAEYDAAVLVSEHNVIFMHYNPLTDSSFPSDVLLIGDFDNFTSVSSCNINWTTNDIEFLETVPLSSASSAKRYLPRRTRGENDDLKKPFFDMLDQISGDIGDIKDVVGKFGPAGKSASVLCDAWTTVLIPIMKYQLYDDDEIGQRQFFQDMFTAQVMSVVQKAVGKGTEAAKNKTVSYLCKVTGVKEEDVNMALWAYDQIERVVDKTNEYRNIDTKTYNDKGVQASQTYGTMCEQAAPVVNVTHEREQNAPVSVSLTVGLVTNTTINVSGKVRIDDTMYANVVSAGYVYYVGNKEYRVTTGVDGNFNIKPATIQNLQPNTTYRVAAYYEALASSRTFYSDFATVQTTGETEDNEWEGTKWHFSGNLKIHDSIEGDSGGPIDFTIDLTDLDNWDTDLQLEGERSYSIDSDGNLILTITYSDREQDSDGYNWVNYEFKFTLHRTSTTKATLDLWGEDEGEWHSDLLNKTEKSYAIYEGLFEGTLIQ